MGKADKHKFIHESSDRARYGRRLRADGHDQKDTGCGCVLFAVTVVVLLGIISLVKGTASFKVIAIFSGIILGIALIVALYNHISGQEKIDRGKREEWIEDGDISDDFPD